MSRNLSFSHFCCYCKMLKKTPFLSSSYNLNIVMSKAHQYLQLNIQIFFFCLFVSNLYGTKFPEGSFASTSEGTRKMRLTKTKTRPEEEQDSNTGQDCSKDCSEEQNRILLHSSSHRPHSNFPQLCSAYYHWVQC